MVRLSSSPGARIASLRSLSTSRPTTPGCAASHHPQVGDASGSAGGRRFSSSASVEPGWSSVVTTVMEGWARWSVTRLRSRLPRVVRVRRSRVGDRSHDACPRMRAQDDQALRAGGPSTGRQANKVTRSERHETRPRTSTVTHTTDRPQPNSTRQPRRKPRPRAAAPRAARRDEHKSERQRATARNGRPRPPPRQHSSRREADARRAVIREAKRAESPARPGRKADQESPLRGGGERGGAFWVVQLHRNSAEKCL